MAISCASLSDETANQILLKLSVISGSSEGGEFRAAQSNGAPSIELDDDNPKSLSESESDESDEAFPDSIEGRSATAYLNYMRECKRRFGAMYHGQKAVKVAAQRWRTMSPEQRSRYRRAGYRSASSITAIKQGTEQDALTSETICIVDPSDSSLDEEECGKKHKLGCGKPKRKKSSCGKRRRKKSACKKQKLKKFCRKPKKGKRTC
ncbi:histone-like protein 18C [Drosophila obscura]|uniref:histone-like protein 18C n=1 Tax=Drosophila obscura TaxID=7282 RepID=UPI001BB1DEA7|nr:histone-like protein 18C [Drosophila obscura]